MNTPGEAYKSGNAVSASQSRSNPPVRLTRRAGVMEGVMTSSVLLCALGDQEFSAT